MLNWKISKIYSLFKGSVKRMFKIWGYSLVVEYLIVD